MKRFSVLLLIIPFVFSNCVSRKEIAYFQNIDQVDPSALKDSSEIEIKPNDILSIVVSASDIEAARPFNLLVETRPANTNGFTSNLYQNNVQQQSYLVASNGTIQFPVLGELQIEGLTTTQLKDLLVEKLQTYLKNPIVTIRLLNFQISVLGEVARPGSYMVSGERISLPAALGLAGDLTIYGKRDNILVIRETENGKKYKYVNLTDASVMKDSEFYYLSQNDVVYVEPNKAQRQASTFNRNSTVYISVASLLVSVLVLIFR